MNETEEQIKRQIYDMWGAGSAYAETYRCLCRDARMWRDSLKPGPKRSHLTVNGTPWCQSKASSCIHTLVHEDDDLRKIVKEQKLSLACNNGHAENLRTAKFLREYGFNVEVTPGECPTVEGE